MCGIIGVIAPASINVPPLLLEGLKRLEYRGYDSAGIATISKEGELLCRRSQGKLHFLEQEIATNPIHGNTGIGHTRWATHGRPTRDNAHPHATAKVAVVHNGIIENFRDLRARLRAEGCTLSSDTDTEVIPHLITLFLEQGLSPEEAVAKAIRMLSGTFALAIAFAGRDQFLMAARRGSPLALGYGEEQMYIGSDAIALSPFTPRISYLEDGDLACLSNNEAIVWDENGDRVSRLVRNAKQSGALLGKNGYRHYMLKEIHEQPTVLGSTLKEYIDPEAQAIRLPEMPFNLSALPQITIVACGTSYYAGMVAKYWLEKTARIPVTLDIASEFRYRETPLPQGGLALFISQSGETADTLAALRFAKAQKQHIVSLVNVTESTMALESSAILPTPAGAEIGVASTKAFTTQLAVLACLTLKIAEANGILSTEVRIHALTALSQLPALVMSCLSHEDSLRKLARKIMNARNALYVGRGTSYAVALEGALKLKELTYIHAEGIAAGELKHGPIALIDEHVPIIAVAPSDGLLEKTCSNIQEIAARNGKIIALCDDAGTTLLGDSVDHTVLLPECHPLVAPILYTMPLQLLAYHAAVARGHDVDQPRNLAKSVTVE